MVASVLNQTLLSGLVVNAGDEEILQLSVDSTSVATFSGAAPQAININAPLIENNQTLTASYTIPVGKNAFSSGPIQVPIDTVVRVSPGSCWTII